MIIWLTDDEAISLRVAIDRIRALPKAEADQEILAKLHEQLKNNQPECFVVTK
jgi:predicted DNA-binding transcriptional regulator YafY